MKTRWREHTMEMVPWCMGWREVFCPVSGGLLISMVCMAMMSGPVKHSTYRRISGREQY